MNSISAWNIFCQSMLANIDGETDYPELDYQFDQFLFATAITNGCIWKWLQV